MRQSPSAAPAPASGGRAGLLPGLDLVKPVLALLVIWIHTAPLGHLAPHVDVYVTIVLGRLAVPLYLAISGYLLFRRERPPVRRQLTRLAQLYLIWCLLYLPVIVRDRPAPLTATALVRLVLTGGDTHLWYLPACAVGIAVVACGLRRWSATTLAVVLLAVYLLGIVLYCALDAGLLPTTGMAGLPARCLELLDAVAMAPRDGLFTGSAFVAVGAWIGREGGWRVRPALALAVPAMGGMLVEGVLRRALHLGADLSLPVSTSYLCLAVFVPAVMSLLVAWRPSQRVRGQILARNTGSLMYFIHYAVIALLGYSLESSAGVRGFLAVTVISGALAVALVRLSAHPRLRFLARLY